MKRILILPVLLLLMFAACRSKSNNEEPKTAKPKPQKPELIKGIALASAKDTICGMSVKYGAADTLLLKGKIYGFCGTGCKDEFVKQLQQKKK